jgi:hypothetical protein
MPPVGFEPTISVGERPQALAWLFRAETCRLEVFLTKNLMCLTGENLHLEYTVNASTKFPHPAVTYVSYELMAKTGKGW